MNANERLLVPDIEVSPVEAGQWVAGYRDLADGFHYIAAIDQVAEGHHRIYDVDVIQAELPGVTELAAARYETLDAARAALADWYARTHSESGD